MEQFINSRIDTIGEITSGKYHFAQCFEAFYNLLFSLKGKLTPEEIEKIEELHATITGIVEREFYLAGLNDGLRVSQITRGGAISVAS